MDNTAFIHFAPLAPAPAAAVPPTAVQPVDPRLGLPFHPHGAYPLAPGPPPAVPQVTPSGQSALDLRRSARFYQEVADGYTALADSCDAMAELYEPE
ncbi:hypothetical protein IMZ48_00585 [Candidatus Bathyarchaeota archaeon]|nr:hypothetical protein [Candidatus Bathyarchaeota archaeon]